MAHLSHCKSSRTTNRIQSHAVLDQQFARFCKINFNDSQFSIEKGVSQDDKRALAIMEESAELCDGHYEIALPHVDTCSNPADDASRGLSAEEKNRWINGPSFLWEAEDSWLRQPDIPAEIKEDDHEVKKERKAFSVASTAEADSLNRMIQSCSSWYKLKKLMAWILRYRCNLLRECYRRKEGEAKALLHGKPSPISVEEMHSSEIEVLKYVQG